MPDEFSVSRRRRKLARPQELLDAAFGLFVEKGFGAARAEEVAARAGVSKGTLYLYYRSKEELLRAVIAWRLSQIFQATARMSPSSHVTHRDLLRQAILEWCTHLAAGPTSGLVKLVITEARNFPEIAGSWVRDFIEPGRQLIAALVRQGMESGEFRRMDPDAVAQSLLLPIIMMCLNKHTIGACLAVDPLGNQPGFVDHHVELVLNGLQPAGGHPQTISAPPSDQRSGWTL